MKKLKKFLFDFDYEYLHPIRIFFRVQYERICRSISYAIFTWDLVDFDSHSMFTIMAFKLERVKKCMDEGYGVYPKATTDAIKEAIKICKRLGNDDYEAPYRKIHDKKWGRPRFFDKKGEFSFNLARKNVKSKYDKKKESDDSRKIMEDALQDRMNDFDRLHVLLKTYQSEWWD